MNKNKIKLKTTRLKRKNSLNDYNGNNEQWSEYFFKNDYAKNRQNIC